MTSATNCTFWWAGLSWGMKSTGYGTTSLLLPCFLHCFSSLPTRHFAHQEVNFHTADGYVCFLLTTRTYWQLHLHCILYCGDQLLTLYNLTTNLMIYCIHVSYFQNINTSNSNACLHHKYRLLPLHIALFQCPSPFHRLVLYATIKNGMGLHIPSS